METRILAERAELLTPMEAKDEGLNVESEFPYIDVAEGEPRLFNLSGKWYDALDFMIYTDEGEWDGYLSDTFFSRLVIRFLDDETFDDGFIRVGLEMF